MTAEPWFAQAIAAATKPYASRDVLAHFLRIAMERLNTEPQGTVKWSEESDQIAHLSALLQVLRHAAQRVIDNDAHFAAHPREDDGEWDDCIRSLRNALFPMTPRQPVPGAEATALEDVAQEAIAYSGIPSGISGANTEGTYFSRAELVAALAHSLETLGYTLVGPPIA